MNRFLETPTTWVTGIHGPERFGPNQQIEAKMVRTGTKDLSVRRYLIQDDFLFVFNV